MGPSASAPRPARRQGRQRHQPWPAACGLNRPQRRRSEASRTLDLGATAKRLRPAAADLRSVWTVAIERPALLRLQGGAESR
jgi:hypothetical protein